MADTQVEVKKTAPTPAPAQDAWQALRTEMDRLFDRFSGGFGFPPLRRMFDPAPAFRATSSVTLPAPAIDIVEDDNGFKLTAELPGMTEQDIEVTVSDDAVTLKGEKKQASEQKDKNFTLSERSYGMFQRSFYLPEGVDRDKIAADFAKGVLTVTMPKSPAAVKQARKIEVKPAA